MSQDMFSPENFAPDTDFLEQSPVVPIPERQTIVPSWYARHKNIRTTVVTKGGQQIAPGFVVAEVAPEFRWAIGEDGEVMGQLEFQQAHEKWYNDQYAFVGQPADDPNLRSVPLVERFVARRVDPHDNTRIQNISRSAEVPGSHVQPVYNANGDRIEESGEVEVPKGMTIKPAENTVSPPPPIEAKPEPVKLATPVYPDYKTPCGKDFQKGARFLHLHTMRCKAEPCAEIEAERKAAKAAKE